MKNVHMKHDRLMLKLTLKRDAGIFKQCCKRLVILMLVCFSVGLKADGLNADSLNADSLNADSLNATGLNANSLNATSLKAESIKTDSLKTDSLKAETNLENYYRTFWNPQYHTKLLDYCLDNKKTCGTAVADRYCRAMGYDKSTKSTIAYDVGVTNYFATCIGCKGWNCKGFKQITCVAKHLRKPIRPYYFRSRKFVYPRLAHYRIDWCYEKGQGCGERAAFSFCRRMGYSKASAYQKDTRIDATRALGNQRLCFGESCNGFKSITCYR